MDKVTVRREGKDVKTVRESYVKRLRDNYLLILRTLMHDLIVSVDKDGTFVFVNDAAVEFWGKSRKKIVGTHFSEYLHPDDIEKTVAAIQDLIEKKNHVKSFMIRMKSPRGIRNVAWNGVAVFDDEGNYMGAQATGKDLTDLMRAEEKLKQSKQHFQQLFEVMVDPIIIVDLDGSILELSQSAEEILGFPRDELVGKHFLETNAATAESKAIMAENMEKMKQGMYIQPHPIEAVTKDGRKLLYELSTARIIYNGEPALLAIFHDITEQKKAEEKLRASEERFKYFLDNAPEAIWVQDLTGTFLDGNKRAEELTGYKRKELIGKNMLEILVPPESVPRLMEAFKANKPGEISGPTELELIKKDGSLVSIEASTIPVERDGKIEIIGITRDITERKKAEEALKKSEERFRSTLEGMLEGCQLIDYNWSYLYVNDAAAKHGRLAKKEVIGKTMMEVYPRIEKTKVFSVLSRCMKERVPAHIENEFTFPNGESGWFEISIEPVPEGIFILSIDISDRKEIEGALHRHQQMLEIVTENINAGLILVSKDYIVLWANDFLKKDLGAIEGKHCYSAINHREDICHGCGVKEVFETGKAVVVREELVPTPDGQEVWLEVSASAIRDENGEIVAASEMSWDITERKKMEQELKKSEEKYRTQFEEALDAIFLADAETGILVDCNRAATELVGRTKSELIGKPQSILHPPEDLKGDFTGGFKKHLNEDPLQVLDERVITKNGEIKNVAIKATIFEVENKKIMQGTFRDITKRKKAEEALQESEKRFRELSELLPETVFETDTTGVLTFVNQTGFDLFGFSREDFEKGLPFPKMLTPESQERVKKNIGRILNGEKLGANEYTGVRKDGSTFPLLAHCSSIIHENKPVGIRGVIVDITERKLLEKALQESEERFKQVAENAVEWIWDVDVDGLYTYSSPAVETVLGYKPEELVGKKHFYDLFPPEEQENLKETAFSAFKEKQSFHEFINRNVHKNGNVVWLSTSGVPILDDEGELVGYRGADVDITERKKMEDKILDQNDFLNTVLDTITYPFYVVNVKDYTIKMANSAAAVFGSLTENSTCYALTHKRSKPCTRPEHACTIEEIKKTKKPVVLEHIHYDAKGNPRLFELRGYPIFDKDGNVVQVIESSMDITERKKAEEALRESEKKYRAIINAMNDTAWVVGFDGKFIDVNDAAVKVLGYSRDELLSMGSTDIDNTLTAEEIKGRLKGMKTDELQVFETALTTKDGNKIPVEISTSRVVYRGEPAVLSIARDVTERKKAQEAISEANHLLKQSNEELESYTYVVSHDLKAPLRTIRSFGSFLLEDYGDRLNETGQDYLNRMVNAASHLDSMIEDLLVLSRVGRKFTEFEKVDLNKLLNEILADLEATIKERNAKVVVDKLPVIHVQRVWIRQVFMNLISNALKFNETKIPKIEVLHEERETDHLFKVRDNGIGIEKKYLTRIFNLFERAPTEKKYDGTGAGLSICKKIVEQFGGKIWVESTPSEGSTFLFTIPKEIKQEEET